MARGRMISITTWKNEALAKFSFMERLLWIGLITTADDQGRGRGHPGLVRSTVFPLDDIPLTDIAASLSNFAALGLIILYTDSEQTQLYQIAKWWDHQHLTWAWPSTLQPPDGWQDHVRYRQGNAVVKDGWPWPDGDLAPEPPEPPTEPTVAPPRPHGDARPRSANSISGSTSISGSGNEPAPAQSIAAGAASPAGGGGPLSDPELDAAWAKTLVNLYAQNREMYRSWLHDSQLTADAGNGHYVLWVTNANAQEWCTHRLKVPIQRALAPELGRALDDLPELEFAVEAAI